MKVTSSKPKNQRIFKCQTAIYKIHGKSKKYRRPFWIEPVGMDLWFSLETGEWISMDKTVVGGRASCYYSMTHAGYNNAYSLKAVKRLIHKWNVPKGTKFRASLPFVGYDFFITK